MFYYAQLNEDNICITISRLNNQVNHDNMILLENYDEDYIWRKYENGEWSEEKFEPEPEPEPPSEVDLLKAKIQSLEEYSEEHEAALIELTELIISLLGGDE